MNRIIKFLMISDILMFTSFGLIDPVLAIFFKEDLVGGSIFTAGLASMIFLMVKSVVQLPFSRKVDSLSYKRRVHWLMLGAFLMSITPFMYIFATNIKHVLAIQVLYGLGGGLAYPTWLGLWSTHLDKSKESFEWSLYSTVTGIGTALTAALGAALVQYIGFNITFAIVGVFSLCGCLVLFELDRKKRKVDNFKQIQYHKRRKLLNSKSVRV